MFLGYRACYSETNANFFSGIGAEQAVLAYCFQNNAVWVVAD